MTTLVNPYESPGRESSLSIAHRQTVDAVATAKLGSIHVRGSLSLGDFLHAHGLMLRQRVHRLVLLIAVYLCAIGGLAVLEKGPGKWLFSRVAYNGVVVVPILMAISLCWIWYRLFRKSQNQTGLFAPTSTLIDDHGLQSKLNAASAPAHTAMAEAGDVAESEITSIAWDAFHEVLVSDRVALLFLKNSSTFLILPRDKLRNPADWSRLVAYLQTRFSPR